MGGGGKVLGGPMVGGGMVGGGGKVLGGPMVGGGMVGGGGKVNGGMVGGGGNVGTVNPGMVGGGGSCAVLDGSRTSPVMIATREATAIRHARITTSLSGGTLSAGNRCVESSSEPAGVGGGSGI